MCSVPVSSVLGTMFCKGFLNAVIPPKIRWVNVLELTPLFLCLLMYISKK